MKIQVKQLCKKAILERASTCTSTKVLAKVEGEIIPNMQELGKYEKKMLANLQNDFFHLVKNPDDPSGGGFYKGWTPEEIRSLYFVLYGESMED